jgi:hypothetical protein
MFPKSTLAPPGRVDKLPFTDTLHTEFMDITLVLEQHSPLYQHIGRSRPDACHLSIFMGHLEEEMPSVILGGLREFGCQCPCVAFDGVYFDAHIVSDDRLRTLMGRTYKDYGVSTHVKDLQGNVVMSFSGHDEQKNDRLSRKQPMQLVHG